MRFGILVFPGTWSDTDCYHQVKSILGQDAEYVWHQETSLDRFDSVILPGGFSYGDYLRPGAMARFSPVMDALNGFVATGRTAIGICNGFQILCESGLLPGALLPNQHLEYRCQWSYLRTERADTPFSNTCRQGQLLKVPVSHGEGNYFADTETLAQLEEDGRVLFRYCDIEGQASAEANPNGSANNIAGIINETGNVLGMMPHPERSCEAILGSTDGNLIFESIIESCREGSRQG
ncbi:MAG: phosphoribosylformylglycinamidine synthase subunit PurQ [SAR202 cluster bacterium]|nr:phosphoribosylformylglycinamidine synthase subunit PurQ [SAR202 cluster bacterium]HCP23627.1 phosphoribosylformylglycinamidine synthase I [Dehalococcoidia bacterium]|tara:strand:+ start:55 stop:762 length:708 start_codon:yes stop_codon:yes gene_type:complete